MRRRRKSSTRTRKAFKRGFKNQKRRAKRTNAYRMARGGLRL